MQGDAAGGYLAPQAQGRRGAGKPIGAITTPLWVWSAHRWSRKTVLAICAGMWGIWGVAAGFAQMFTQLLLLSTLLAAGYAGAHPIITTFVGDLFDSPSRGRAIGMLFGATTLASSVLATLKGQLAGAEDDWRCPADRRLTRNGRPHRPHHLASATDGQFRRRRRRHRPRRVRRPRAGRMDPALRPGALDTGHRGLGADAEQFQ
ncbi:MFS transporter [Streptomyces sp. YH02]|uniref:MFS transporter n=1 Tax=Streptomyces sp. YH02 TaxID=3256999 RepID=UPI003756DC39